MSKYTAQFVFLFRMRQSCSTICVNTVTKSCTCVALLSFFCLQGQILANLKAMDSDWFAQNYIGRSSKVYYACIQYLYEIVIGPFGGFSSSRFIGPFVPLIDFLHCLLSGNVVINTNYLKLI